MDALNGLYHRVAPNGFVIVDDFGSWPECRRAVEDFFAPEPPLPTNGLMNLPFFGVNHSPSDHTNHRSCAPSIMFHPSRPSQPHHCIALRRPKLSD
ncbi:MAG: hypothetical protein J6386_18850 [Candidatus Synoicihabitans palmerolidicus]|nr:hypothetical protein [Candidatus Synoicihabitans palmerolidicus]